MSKYRDYVFLLWGDGFDEAVATILVTELRKAGLRVKVVGLTPRQIGGAYGLALVPDLTLDQALPLASQAICLIIPSRLSWSKYLHNDPRICQLIEQANPGQTKLVVGTWDEPMQADLALPENIEENVIIYPETEDIVEFARKTAKLLSRESINGNQKV
jgi:hypothetical protein